VFEHRIVFGTAGHVDHGKSALVRALTGMDPDRLAEEKVRKMTIVLGFAFLPLPDIQKTVAIVDVPGHEMFERNMVAGATGIDAVIFVVATDEGVKPQTREHLDVLNLLEVPAGVIALTKTDLCGPERIEQTGAQVRDLVAGTFLEAAPVVPVSSVTGEGIPLLKDELSRIAGGVKPRPENGIYRQPIDRVFTLKGVGTVITGTVISGSLEVGAVVRCLPGGEEFRARNLHVHHESVSRIVASQRAAVNLADANRDDIRRGDVLCTPGSLEPTLMMDVRVRLLPAASRPLAHRTRVRIHHGTREVLARAVPLESDQVKPGASAFVQMRLESPLVPVAGDLFVMRTYSPMRVMGGGRVLDAHPPKRTRAGGTADVAKKEALSPEEAILDALDGEGARGMPFERIRTASGLPEQAVRSALKEAEAQGRAYAGRGSRWFGAGVIEEMQTEISARLAELHSKDPLYTFVSLNDVSSGAAASEDLRECFRFALKQLTVKGTVVLSDERVHLASYRPQWTGKPAEAREKILQACAKSGLSVPNPQELAALVGLDEAACRRILGAISDAGELVAVSNAVYTPPDTLEDCRKAVRNFIAKNGRITVSECRKLLGASRKYIIPLLERFDREGLTVREGDHRVLR